jgi:hypothetical protein
MNIVFKILTSLTLDAFVIKIRQQSSLRKHMGIISLILAALGLASSDRPKPSKSGVLRPNLNDQIPHLPPPSLPSTGHHLQTETRPKSENPQKSPDPVQLTINLRNLPNFQRWIGPLPLTNDTISKSIIPYKPGHFLIGMLHDKDKLIVKKIGRSSDNLCAELEKFSSYASHFIAHVDLTAQESFIEACLLYHSFGKKSGLKHPMRSFEEGWGCPKCGIFNVGS